MAATTGYAPLYTDEEMKRFKERADIQKSRQPVQRWKNKIQVSSGPSKIKKAEERTQPSKFATAMDTVKQSAIQAPVSIQRSPIFTRARENLQKDFDNTVWGSPFVKDPQTGKMIEKAGYYSEGGAFIPEERLGVKDVGPMYSYLSTYVRDPKSREHMMQGLMKRAGATPETEGMGAGLNRALEERLTQSKLASEERIASVQTKGGIEEARLLSEGRTAAATTDPLKLYGGTLSRTDEETGYKYDVPYSEYTGQAAPGYESGMQAELPTDIKQRWESMKAEERKRFYMDNPQYRSALKRLYE